MKDPIVDYPEIINTPLYFHKAIYKTKIAWISLAFFFVVTSLSVYLFDCKNDECDVQISIFFLVCSFTAYLSSLGGFINVIESFMKKEEVVGPLRYFLLGANFSIFGLITIGILCLLFAYLF